MLMPGSTQRIRELEIEATARWVFQLSYFLLADRKDAHSVLRQATSRLYVTALTQKKRQAKRPKNEVHKKLALTPRQLLQYLTYLCAEPYEAMQEQEHRAGARVLTLDDMLVRYVKHLVLLYLEHNSFYAAVGQGCVLFDLGTSQAERLYEVLVQGSPAHLDTKGDYSVRDAKREIRQRLGRRFEGFLTNCEGARREQLFVTMSDPGPHFRFVKRCLHRLRPVGGEEEPAGGWHLPARFDPLAYDLAELQYDGGNADPRAEQAAESRRLHAVTHPCCWARLLRASCHHYSRQRLVLPEFKLHSRKSDDHMLPQDRQHPPELTPAEMKGLAETLKGEARRRKGLFAARLTVSVDGAARCSWEVYRERVLSLRVEPSARALTVSARDAGGELLLAQYLLRMAGAAGQGPAAVTLESGQEFTFTVAPPARAGEGPTVTIRFRETRLDRALLGGLAGAGLLTSAKLKTAAAFAALLAVLLAGWWGARDLLSPRTPPGESPDVAAGHPPAEPARRPDEDGKSKRDEEAAPPARTRQHEPPAAPKELSEIPPGPRPRGPRAPKQPAEVSPELRDGSRLVKLDGRGRQKGLEGLPASWRREVGEALASQRVKRPPVLDALESGAGALRGPGGGAPFAILGPAGVVVESDRPSFRWGAPGGATSYAVSVFDSRLNKVAESGPLTATEWTPPRPLRRGATYSWQVTAVLGGKEVVSPGAAAPEAKFAVVGQAESEELRRARRSLPDSHLMLGVLYARAGLLEEAEREFRALVESNPNSSVALNLLGSVRKLRRAR